MRERHDTVVIGDSSAAQAQRSATTLIGVLAAVSVAGVFVVLYLLYPSVRVSLQILNAVPTAFIGGVMALVLTNQTLTVASLVGFVSLGGIAVQVGLLEVELAHHPAQHVVVDLARVAPRDELRP